MAVRFHADQTVHCLRDIACGEELTISYVAGAEAGARNERRHLLHRKFGFTCACDACVLDGVELMESDARYRRVKEIHTLLAEEDLGEALVPLVAEHYRLMRAEGVPLILGKAGWILAIASLVQSGALEAAVGWARLAADCARVALGDDSSAYVQFAKILGER